MGTLAGGGCKPFARFNRAHEGGESVDDTRPRRGRRRKAPLPEPAPALVPDGKPTLRTIAQMTGLAVTTISRALNNAPELATDTRERVQRIATAIGYVPDRTATDLVQQLRDGGVAEAVHEGDAIRYAPAAELRERLDALAHWYTVDLVTITQLIHSRIDRRAQQFADAFRIRKE